VFLIVAGKGKVCQARQQTRLPLPLASPLPPAQCQQVKQTRPSLRASRRHCEACNAEAIQRKPPCLDCFALRARKDGSPCRLPSHPLSLIPYPLSLIPYPLSLIPYPLSPYPLSLIRYPLSLIPYPLSLILTP
jgi:hypothetical protein